MQLTLLLSLLLSQPGLMESDSLRHMTNVHTNRKDFINSFWNENRYIILRYLDRTWILDPLTHSSLSVCHLYTPDGAIRVKGHFEE